MKTLKLRYCLFLLFAFCFRLVAQEAPAVTVTDAGGRPMNGIVCDNLRSTREEDRNRLILKIADAGDVSYQATLCTSPQHEKCNAVDADGLGEVRSEKSAVLYYPPAEFNENPQPEENAFPEWLLPGRKAKKRSDVKPLTVGATREVTIHLKANVPNAPLVSKTIVLARPSVVLVHGINTRAESWNGIKEGIHGEGLAPVLRRIGYSVVTLDHGLDDLEDSQQAERGGIYFKGNGPVEWHAARLGRLIAQTIARRNDDGFATRRVDVLGRSYGGVITRWYLRTNFQQHSAAMPDSRRWYIQSSNIPGGASVYWLPSFFYNDEWQALPKPGQTHFAPPIRKFISVSSIWRGVPLCNYVNEVRAGDAPETINETRLGDAPVRWAGSIPIISSHFSNLRSVLDVRVGKSPPTRVPALEVMAVESPWMRFLNQQPFHNDVAYASVAGADNRYPWLSFSQSTLLAADSYRALDVAQRPSLFPYMKLEQRVAQNGDDHLNFSDGVVPLWSALIPDHDAFPSQSIVPAHHANIVSDESAIKYIVRALNHAALPTGKALTARWNEPIAAPARSFVWHFSRAEMAPDNHARLYVLREGAGRINPHALGEIDDAMHSAPQADGDGFSVKISWHSATPWCGRVKLYQPWRDPGTGQLSFTRVQNMPPDGFAENDCGAAKTTASMNFRHEVTLRGLKAGEYYYRVEMEVPHGAGDRIVLATPSNFGHRGFVHRFVVP